MNRREFLKAMGLGGLALVAPEIIEPERKLWFVPSNAPVGSRVERLGLGYNPAWDIGYGDDLEVPSPGGPVWRIEDVYSDGTGPVQLHVRTVNDLDFGRPNRAMRLEMIDEVVDFTPEQYAAIAGRFEAAQRKRMATKRALWAAMDEMAERDEEQLRAWFEGRG